MSGLVGGDEVTVAGLSESSSDFIEALLLAEVVEVIEVAV
jgi:hypothetical protein